MTEEEVNVDRLRSTVEEALGFMGCSECNGNDGCWHCGPIERKAHDALYALARAALRAANAAGRR